MFNDTVCRLDDLPDFLTVDEAAAVLRLGRSAAYEMTARWRATNGAEGLPVVQLGRCLRVPKAGIERMMNVDPGALDAPATSHPGSTSAS